MNDKIRLTVRLVSIATFCVGLIGSFSEIISIALVAIGFMGFYISGIGCDVK